MSEGSSEGCLFIDILTNLVVKTFYQQITVHLQDIESFLNFSNDNSSNCNDDTCNTYISHLLNFKSLYRNSHNYSSNYINDNSNDNNNNYDDNNNNNNDNNNNNNYNNNNNEITENKNTEKILKKIIKFIIISDHILQSQISPPSIYNRSLSLNTSEKTRIFIGEILVSHLNNPLILFSNFAKFPGINNNPPPIPQNNNFMYPTGVLPQKEGFLLPMPIQTKLIKFVGKDFTYICIYIYIVIYMYTYILINICIYGYRCIYIYIYICIYICMNI
jgi:hypothetical protein